MNRQELGVEMLRKPETKKPGSRMAALDLSLTLRHAMPHPDRVADPAQVGINCSWADVPTLKFITDLGDGRRINLNLVDVAKGTERPLRVMLRSMMCHVPTTL
jgi:hypothetical protein